jgi:hypothetical protein
MFRKYMRALTIVTLASAGSLAMPGIVAAKDQGRRYAANCADTRAHARPVSYRENRSVRRSNLDYEREAERTKTKTALMIGGAAATGAGVGGAMGGTKGALIGAAVGGGAASIYEAIKRR